MDTVTREGLTEIVTLRKHLEEVRGCVVRPSGQACSGREDSVCKGPEAGACCTAKVTEEDSQTRVKVGGEQGGQKEMGVPYFRSLKDFDLV